MENFQFITQQHELENILGKIGQYDKICVDLECGGLNPRQNELLLLQIATPYEVFVIDTRRVNLEPLKPILENPRILKILQNAKFDYQFLKLKAGITLHNIYDTMIVEHLLNAGKIMRGQSKLQYLAHKYADIDLQKFDGVGFDEKVNIFTEQQLDYAAKDTTILWKIFEPQKKLLSSEGLTEIARLEFNVLPAIAEMELNGVLVDEGAWKEFTEELKEYRQEQAKKLYNFFAPTIPQTSFLEDVVDINLRSWQQTKAAFEQMDINLPNMQAITLRKYNHPATIALAEFKAYDKLINTYGEKIYEHISPITGRVHADFGQTFTDSGRMSCQDPNLQNIPVKDTPRFRMCFVASEGNKIISADFGQIELRLIADHSNDEALINAFNNNLDVHTLTAQAIFGKDEVTKKERKLAKNMVYGMSYGISAKGFSIKMDVEFLKAKRLIRKFYNQYPEATRWLERNGRRAINRGYAITKLGRKRWFIVAHPINWKDKHTYKLIREARNHPIQGGSADMIKLSLTGIHNRLKDLNAKIILCVHDEICVEVPEKEVEKVKVMMVEEMTKAGQRIIEKVPVIVDYTIGNSWNKEEEE